MYKTMWWFAGIGMAIDNISFIEEIEEDIYDIGEDLKRPYS